MGAYVMSDSKTDQPGEKRSRLSFPALRRWGLDQTETAWLVLVLLIVTVVYLRSLRDGFVYDDFPQIVFNHYLRHWSFAWLAWTRDVWWFRDPDNLPQSPYYRPLQNVFFTFVFPIAGTNPIAWHVIKIVLHLWVVILTFRLGQLLTGSTATALLAGLLFGVLGVHAEPVVWVSAISEPLLAILELATLCSFIQRNPTRLSGLIVPIILFALATSAQEGAVLFPILIAAYVFLLDPAINARSAETYGRPNAVSLGSRIIRTVALALPFFAVDLLYMGVRLYVLGNTAVLGMVRTSGMLDLVGNKVVVRQTVVNPQPSAIFSTLPLVVLTYLELFVMPWLAGPAHPIGFIRVRSPENFYYPVAILGLLFVIGYLALRKTSHARFYLFCVAWWFVNLAPALSLNQVVSLVQDRYEYVSSIGFCLLVADLCVTLASQGWFWRRAIAIGVVVFASAQVIALWIAEPIWHDNESMFRRGVEIFPGSTHFRERYAEALEDKGDLRDAAVQLAAAAKDDPSEYIVHYQLGQLYLRMGRHRDAQREFRAYLMGFAPWTVGGAPPAQPGTGQQK
jgi:hypothetical protein